MSDYVSAYVLDPLSANAIGNSYLDLTGHETFVEDCVFTDNTTGIIVNNGTLRPDGMDSVWHSLPEYNGETEVIVSSPHVAIAPAKICCAYCGQVNKAEREQCRGCGAPLLEAA